MAQPVLVGLVRMNNGNPQPGHFVKAFLHGLWCSPGGADGPPPVGVMTDQVGYLAEDNIVVPIEMGGRPANQEQCFPFLGDSGQWGDGIQNALG